MLAVARRFFPRFVAALGGSEACNISPSPFPPPSEGKKFLALNANRERRAYMCATHCFLELRVLFVAEILLAALTNGVAN